MELQHFFARCFNFVALVPLYCSLEFVRLISWSGIILTLPPLGSKCRAFDWARLWFLLRIFTFSAVMLSGLAVERLDWQRVDAWSGGTRFAMLL